MLARNALTTVEEARRFLGLTEDTGIERAINEASSIIETHCRRSFSVREYSQRISHQDFGLDGYPVINVLSFNGDPLPDDVYIDKVSGLIDTCRSGEIVYTAGYVLPKDETADNPHTLPYDIERACLQLIDTLYVDADGFIGEASAIKIGDWSINQKGAVPGGFIPDDIRSTLDMYRRVLV
ncbi:hypothetical protein BTO30_13495 [Domibacillus antri]|uniref:Phage gp6-like head-tail connector protein n=1 Tax=Domibacillus antri TaxID=1714264 RepID=A0A1Q8Q334_9BACI|nr:hypothetical protein [Domibacillus antri]OLN21712.1 hypothetical protein BTO30_13495 [Domibacillus antri]